MLLLGSAEWGVADFYVKYFGVLVCCIGLIALITFNRGASRFTKLAIAINAACILVIAVAEYVEDFAAYHENMVIVRKIMSTICYSLRLVPLAVLTECLRHRKKYILWIFIPVAVTFLVSLTSLFTDVAFTYTEEGTFSRGPLGYLPHVFGLIYLVLIMINTFNLFRNQDFEEAIVALIVAVAAVSALAIETRTDEHGVLTLAYAVGNLMYYMLIHVQVSSRDPLTGLLNRSSFYHDVRKKGRGIRGFISVDMNELKHINDTWGHDAGDDALRTVANVMTESLGENYPLYRLGGDEFMVICYATEEEAKKKLEAARKAVEDVQYSCAMGLAHYEVDKDYDLEELQKKADDRMYEDKGRMKEEAEKSGKKLWLR